MKRIFKSINLQEKIKCLDKIGSQQIISLHLQVPMDQIQRTLKLLLFIKLKNYKQRKEEYHKVSIQTIFME